MRVEPFVVGNIEVAGEGCSEPHGRGVAGWLAPGSIALPFAAESCH